MSNELLGIQECQQIELGIMEALHKFCLQNGMRYLLSNGTLIGAVRHHGFIPWDNDMDIVMPRTDYEKLISLLKDRMIEDRYYLLHWSTDNHYHYQCARICDSFTSVHASGIREQPIKMGVWVDIFPVDGIETRRFYSWSHGMHLKLLKNLQRANNYKASNSSGIKAIGKALLQLLFPGKNNLWQRKLDRCAAKVSFRGQNLGGNITEWDRTFDEMKIEDFEHPILSEFETAQFNIPARFDIILRHEYGDYMKLPPESERFTHPIDARWVDVCSG